ncbi:capsular biosynthesis protein [Caballeronia sp. LZ035]|uniref:capsular polysaccharide export protein, LipB/KpsS family n=1 Tax=Caballeronia sp. LZ035 TaxID=3038568 RepID=UPI002862788B|nr:capsular biosynthesis protein [Caballeronia sp. LZ035]MDR5757612.1 capsular biosynthesis protein [Caballeronia sp. LZ035]
MSMSGPVWSNAPRGTRMLSRWIVPSEALTDALHDITLGLSPSIAHTMQRVLSAHATPARDRLPYCAPALLTARERTRVLIIDQRQRSCTMHGVARNDPRTWSLMFDAARTSHPDAELWITRSGERARGTWLSASCDLTLHDVRSIDDRYSICAAFAHVDHVYTLSAAEGMHALIAGKPVHVFGAPYYAGWGLTHDANALPDRTARPTLHALFELTFMHWARYVDPSTHKEGTLDQLLDALEAHAQVRQRFADLPTVAGVRFQIWKRPFATPFLRAGGNALCWTDEPGQRSCHELAAFWGARSAKGLPDGVKHFRIEDGFLHSCGLGSDMIAPMSQVIDQRGIYFDASRPSDLSTLLNETDFSETELARSAALRRSIVEAGLTKYNLGRCAPAWRAPRGKRVVLVPGQVADDASIRLGTRGITTADALLREVRRLRRDAFIVYKPHPDVLSGNREGLIDAHSLADMVDIEADLLSLVDRADEVHTLSSLAGFDALLRGKDVFTYGMPFYAGWGLTHDALAPPSWRKRTLTLDQLVAGALIRYPIYFDWHLAIHTTPEAIVQQLARRASRPLSKQPKHLRMLLKIIRWCRNALRHMAWRVRHAHCGSTESNTQAQEQ